MDRRYLRRALELAEKSFALASPNPNVGALLVDAGGHIVGEGFYTYAGVRHAEIQAIEQAGEKARNSTLYINFEPCSHYGRTGPCAEAVIAAGIRRVVASMADPNPLVRGQGFERLRQAGVDVTSGVLEEDARPLNDAFAKYIRHRMPLVTLKGALTLDGKIAPPPADVASHRARATPQAAGNWITGEEARAHVQELRHEHDSILVGVGTILQDNPLLTDRSGRARRRPLLRVVVDSHLRLPPDSRVVETANDDVVVFCSLAEDTKKLKLQERGIQVEEVAGGGDGRPDLRVVAQRLAAREITSLVIEGGAMVNGAALVSAIADKVFFYYTPKILGGSDSISYAAAGFLRLSDAAHLKLLRLHRFGKDFAVEGYLRDPHID
ncbi:MAG: bifunctional diaminohydroxyphosphoribosylaminopyrimidine deaminase/5-amino-6-(5-phosphoribosylamino)uracil reductase RibD [Acidobacteria bacterium]|nr:bifunctional diaminohydroxyphosphoribosylaminopyrimidine deaminase/5-amino-6-(5-phosphoribosylamino)uracil reductase RibD [Acidobacteriota bacterium]